MNNLPPVEMRFVATAPHPSGKCPSCKRKTQHFYHYADGNTKLCIRCIEAGLKFQGGRAMSAPRRFVAPGDVVRLEVPFSEVCMYMHVAGEVMDVRFQSPFGYPNAQLLLEDGREFSAPITPGEAGFFFEDGRYYCYPVQENL